MTRRSSALKPDIVAEASEWFIEFRSGDATAGMRARFDEWLRRSPEHIQAYLEVAAGWSELPTADPEGRIDIQAIVARARGSGEGNNVTPISFGASATRRIRTRVWVSTLAASLTLVAIALGVAVWMTGYQGVYRTGIGEQRTLTLADGSTVILNALTTVRVRLSESVRVVELVRGQAFFHDTEDRERPFVVRSDGATVRAIGTQFDVYRRPDGMVVTVVEGQVAVAESPAHRPTPASKASESKRVEESPPRLAPVLVSAGEQVIVTAQLIRKPQSADVAAATAWLEKRLVFEDTPLGEVAAEFNLYSSRRLIIADPALRSVGISGVYSSADPDSLIGFLRAQQDLSITETDKEIRVTRRAQK